MLLRFILSVICFVHIGNFCWIIKLKNFEFCQPIPTRFGDKKAFIGMNLKKPSFLILKTSNQHIEIKFDEKIKALNKEFKAFLRQS